MPLTMVSVNEPNTIIRIGGKEETRRFLENLGFVPGGVVTVISTNGGNMIVEIKGARIDVYKRQIQEYIMPEILRRYDAIDINVYEANLFHTKMVVKELDLQDYLFKTDVYELPPTKRLEIINSPVSYTHLDVYKRQV